MITQIPVNASIFFRFLVNYFLMKGGFLRKRLDRGGNECRMVGIEREICPFLVLFPHMEVLVIAVMEKKSYVFTTYMYNPFTSICMGRLGSLYRMMK